MPQPRVHPFWFAVILDSARKIKAAFPRDAFAAQFVLSQLIREGYELGDAFLNFPEEPGSRRRPRRSEYTQFDLSRLRPGDLILETTRFPLNDPPRYRKRVPRGFTELEAKLWDFWSQFFDYVDRGNLTLKPDLEDSLLPGREAYVNVELQMKGGSDVKLVAGDGYRGAPPLPGSVAFFLRTEQAWPDGPGLCAAFAMDAEATAAWNWILCNKMPELVRRRGFFMAALERPPERNVRGWYSDFATDWKAELVLEHAFENESF